MCLCLPPFQLPFPNRMAPSRPRSAPSPPAVCPCGLLFLGAGQRPGHVHTYLRSGLRLAVGGWMGGRLGRWACGQWQGPPWQAAKHPGSRAAANSIHSYPAFMSVLLRLTPPLPPWARLSWSLRTSRIRSLMIPPRSWQTFPKNSCKQQSTLTGRYVKKGGSTRGWEPVGKNHVFMQEERRAYENSMITYSYYSSVR